MDGGPEDSNDLRIGGQGGLVVDGTRGPPREADVAVSVHRAVAVAPDLDPAGEPRFISRCEGMKAVVVNGTVLIEDGAPAITGGPWPGRLLRRFDE